MNSLLHQLSNLVRQKVVVSVAHKQTAQSPIINDTTLQAFISNIAEDQNNLTFHIASGSSEGTTTSISIPKSAIVSTTGASTTIHYTKGTQTVIISFRPVGATITASQPIPEKPDYPSVKEFKLPNGELSKIVIHIPSDTVDQLLLQTAVQVVNELLREWRQISLAKRMGGQLTWQYKKISIKEVTLVYLPGDSFMQIQAAEQKEQVTIDLPFDLFVNLQNKTISYTFDDVHYELVQAH